MASVFWLVVILIYTLQGMALLVFLAHSLRRWRPWPAIGAFLTVFVTWTVVGSVVFRWSGHVCP